MATVRRKDFKAPDEYPEGFERLWFLWPAHKRKAKALVYRAWLKAIDTVERRRKCDQVMAQQFLLKCATDYLHSPVGQSRYCNGPEPWLNQERWDDDPAAWELWSREPAPAAGRFADVDLSDLERGA